MQSLHWLWHSWGKQLARYWKTAWCFLHVSDHVENEPYTITIRWPTLSVPKLHSGTLDLAMLLHLLLSYCWNWPSLPVGMRSRQNPLYASLRQVTYRVPSASRGHHGETTSIEHAMCSRDQEYFVFGMIWGNWKGITDRKGVWYIWFNMELVSIVGRQVDKLDKGIETVGRYG